MLRHDRHDGGRFTRKPCLFSGRLYGQNGRNGQYGRTGRARDLSVHRVHMVHIVHTDPKDAPVFSLAFPDKGTKRCCTPIHCSHVPLWTPFPGGSSGGTPPLPMPNSPVTPSSANGTGRAIAWESRPLPGINSTPCDVFVAGRFLHFRPNFSNKS